MWDNWEDFVRSVNIAGWAWNDLLGQGANKVASVGGIKFPATQVASTDANTLDDYEEGSWTPIDGSGAGLAFTTPTGSYTKIGNICIAIGTFTFPVTANGANSTIGGFPFTCHNSQEARAGLLSYHNGATARTFVIDNNTTTGKPYTAAGANVTNAQMSTTLSYIQAIYKVA